MLEVSEEFVFSS